MLSTQQDSASRTAFCCRRKIPIQVSGWRMLCKCWGLTRGSIAHDYLILFIGAYLLDVLGPWAARVLTLSHEDTEMLL